MSAHGEKESKSTGGYGNLKPVALSILVMGISLAIVIVLWAWFGYIGPSFSSTVLAQQQNHLRAQYGLEPLPKLSAEQMEIPPSMRNLPASSAGAE